MLDFLGWLKQQLLVAIANNLCLLNLFKFNQSHSHFVRQRGKVGGVLFAENLAAESLLYGGVFLLCNLCAARCQCCCLCYQICHAPNSDVPFPLLIVCLILENIWQAVAVSCVSFCSAGKSGENSWQMLQIHRLLGD